MVARNFSLQDMPYNRVLQVPDDEREYLTLDELKPHQLTELGVTVSSSLPVTSQPQRTVPATADMAPNGAVLSGSDLLPNYHHHNAFYELGASHAPMAK